MNKTVNVPVNGACRAKGGLRQVIDSKWRRVPESNRSSRICNPVRNLSANPPLPEACGCLAVSEGGRKMAVCRQRGCCGSGAPIWKRPLQPEWWRGRVVCRSGDQAPGFSGTANRKVSPMLSSTPSLSVTTQAVPSGAMARPSTLSGTMPFQRARSGIRSRTTSFLTSGSWPPSGAGFRSASAARAICFSCAEAPIWLSRSMT